MSTLKYVLTRGDDDHEMNVTVHYTAHQGSEGSRDGRGGLKLEPDEPGCIEIDGVNNDDSTGEDIDITPRERDEIECAIGEMLAERANDVPGREPLELLED